MRSRAQHPLPPELPRVDIVIDAPEAYLLCACGKHMVKIGEGISEQPNIIPMRIEVLHTLHNLARDALLDSAVIHMDETNVQVLKEPDKATHLAKLHVGATRPGPPGKHVILYDHHPSRSGQVRLRLLEGWQGNLKTDDYDGYNTVVRAGGIEHLICAAHARRKFVEAKRAQTKGKRGSAD